MSIDEFFQAVKEARPDDREKVAKRLLRELDSDERVLAKSTIGEFISSINGVYKLQSDAVTFVLQSRKD